MNEFEFIVIGGGVIGLSIADELARRGRRVAVIDRSDTPGTSSWAGAGMLTPASGLTATHPWDRLRARSIELHAQWSARLARQTGIHNGLFRCGCLYIARSRGEVASLAGLARQWTEEKLDFEEWDARQVRSRLPGLAPLAEQLHAAVWVAEEWQVRNPRHLRALRQSIKLHGGALIDTRSMVRLNTAANRVVAAEFEGQLVRGQQFCLAAGAWTGQLVEPLGVRLDTFPVRGQMLLYRLTEPPFTPIVHESSRYVVPRDDGHVLVGSTVEEVGFNSKTSVEGVAELEHFAAGIHPTLDAAHRIGAWAGLRPATRDGWPAIGSLPQWPNVFVSCGHFRVGLQLSTASAEALVQLMLDGQSAIDLSPFSPARFSREPGRCI